MFKRFFRDMKRYWAYTSYSVKSELKAEVAGSHLNWIWWILEPVCFMFVYWIVFGTLFGRESNFHIFIFIGLTMWNLFNKTVTANVKVIKKNKSIVTKIYLPKYVLVLVNLGVNLFKMLISWGIVAVLLITAGIAPTFSVLWIFPIVIIMVLITFGVSAIIAHLGVYVEDMTNVVRILLQMLFYLSGVFYDISARLADYPLFAELVLKINPVAFLSTAAREVLLYGNALVGWNLLTLGIWFAVGFGLSVLGVWLIYRHENSYAKLV